MASDQPPTRESDASLRRKIDSAGREYVYRIPEPGIQKATPEPGGGEATGYRLISIPLDLENKNPKVVLDDDLGDYEFEWRFFDPSGETLEEFPNTSEMEAGKAFWLLVKNAGRFIDTGEGLTEETDEAFDITLEPGWNAIGNPFNYPVPVTNLRVQNTVPDLWQYEGDWRPLDRE